MIFCEFKNKMALQTVARTCNPIHVHEFSWTIDNFISITKLLNGPSFSPIPNCSVKFRFDFDTALDKAQQVSVNVYLTIDNKNYTSFSLFCDLTMCHGNDTIVKTSKIPFQTVNNGYYMRVIEINLMKKRGEFDSLDLHEDKFILKAKYSLSGFNIVNSMFTTTITNFPVGYKELSKDFKNMFENGFAYDVKFSLDGKTIPAHTSVLCSRSPVFAKMFQHDMLEKNSKKFVIKDINFAIFNTFLLFLYTGEVEAKDWQTVIVLYSIADKYEVMSLRNECSRMMAGSLSVDSVSIVLKLAFLHGDEELKEKAKICVCNNFTRVVQTTDWVNIVDTYPRLASEVLGSLKPLPVAK